MREVLLTMSPVRRDFVMSHLCLQIQTLSGLLRTLEETSEWKDGYADEALRKVEINLRHLRRLWKD